MNIKQFTINGSNNYKLNILTDNATNLDAKGIIINIHGIGSHFQFIYSTNDDIENRFRLFSNINLLPYALEFHGHGKSQGERCCIYNFDDLVYDLDCLVNYIKLIHPNKPIYLIAESMGGAVAIKYEIKHKKKVNGIILLSPMCGIDDSMKPPSYLINLLIFTSTYFPKLKLISTSTKIVKNCKNLEYRQAKLKCKFNYLDKFRLCTGRECYLTSKWINENGYLFESPLFIIHAKNDTITDPKSSISFFNSIKSTDKESFFPESDEHSILVGKSGDEELAKIVCSKIIEWLKKRIK